MNTLIGKIKLNLVKMLLIEDLEKRIKLFENIIFKVLKSLVPIRPGRKNPRIKYKRHKKISSK